MLSTCPQQAIEDGLIDTSTSMHVGIRGSVNDHEDIVADAELVSKMAFLPHVSVRVGIQWKCLRRCSERVVSDVERTRSKMNA